MVGVGNLDVRVDFVSYRGDYSVELSIVESELMSGLKQALCLAVHQLPAVHMNIVD